MYDIASVILGGHHLYPFCCKCTFSNYLDVVDVQIIMISVFMASVGGFVQYEYLLLLENTTP